MVTLSIISNKLKNEIKRLRRNRRAYIHYRDTEIAKQNFGKADKWNVTVLKYESELNTKEDELKELMKP